MAPQCDEPQHLYNVPMKHLGPRHLSGLEAQLDDVYKCVAETCSRHFESGHGYFSLDEGRIRGTPTCECQPTKFTVMALVRVHADHKTVTYGCLRCAGAP
jgi:hypothetical protein